MMMMMMLMMMLMMIMIKMIRMMMMMIMMVLMMTMMINILVKYIICILLFYTPTESILSTKRRRGGGDFSLVVN